MAYLCPTCKYDKAVRAHRDDIGYETRPKKKVCPGCGHITGERTRLCEVCGADQTADMWCATCKTLLPHTSFYKRHDNDRPVKDRFRPWCKVCERDRKKNRDKFNKSSVHNLFAQAIMSDLLESMSDVPLSEDLWLKTCRYFEGCAICGANDIQLRHSFIPRKLGGKYVVGNIIPLCSKCANKFRLSSPINPVYLSQIKGFNIDKIGKIYEFMKGKVYEQF
jgi:RNA polymerase subunit RPABC4/transcription elongation factor Spt4